MSRAMGKIDPSENNRQIERRKERQRLRSRRYRRRRAKAERYGKRYAKRLEIDISERPIRTYDDLVEYLIARRKALGWSQLELDERSGFQSGYSAKLENWRGGQGRVAGSITMPLWLEALGVEFKPVAHWPERVERPRLNGAELSRRVPDRPP